MHRNWRLGLALCWMSLSYAQLSEKPQTWTSLEGHYSGDAHEDSVLLFVDECQAAIAAGQAGGAVHMEAEPARRLGYQALSADNWNAAARLLPRVLAVYRGMTLGEWMEVAASLQFQVDRRIVAPGVTIHVRLEPRFTLDRALKSAYRVHVALLDAQGKVVVERPPEPVLALEAMEFSLRTSGLPTGEYRARYQLLDADGKVRAWAQRRVLLNADVQKRVRVLTEQARKLAASGVGMKGPAQALAVQTVQFTANLYSRSMDGPGLGFLDNAVPLAFVLADLQAPRYQTDPINPERDLPAAEWMAEELLAGRNPLAEKKGDFRLAYRSAQDQSLQPFRLFLPPGYDAAKKWPLVVALHDSGGDEGSYFQQYRGQDGSSLLLKLAAERGYVVAAPYGRGPMSYYAKAARRDVLDVIENVRSAAAIDETQIFLMGHGMGAAGVLTVPMGQPKLFRGLLAVSGTPLEALDYSQTPDIPLLFLQAEKDGRTSLTEVRRLAFVLQRRYKQFDYIELAGQDHESIGVASLTSAVDYFDAVRAGKWKPSGKAIPLPRYSGN
ncbi:hypothetical protein [uncultured Paludibaculum sp.]|uniref:carboxylesterase family protein n=1 Tax=uncultured Paludibaculum sp. TaxID=1765020 RepID=UPI002AAB000F|nr:hypothetical protein [uncultured Paludibaculum sp.]